MKLKPDNFFFSCIRRLCVLPLGLAEFLLLFMHYTLLICFDRCRVSRVSIKLFFSAFYAGGLANRLILDLFLPDLRFL